MQMIDKVKSKEKGLPWMHRGSLDGMRRMAPKSSTEYK